MYYVLEYETQEYTVNAVIQINISKLARLSVAYVQGMQIPFGCEVND